MKRHDRGAGGGVHDNGHRGGAPGGAGPCVSGPAPPKAAGLGNKAWPWARGGPYQSATKGVSQTPWRHRKSGSPDLRTLRADLG